MSGKWGKRGGKEEGKGKGQKREKRGKRFKVVGKHWGFHLFRDWLRLEVEL